MATLKGYLFSKDMFKQIQFALNWLAVEIPSEGGLAQLHIYWKEFIFIYLLICLIVYLLTYLLMFIHVFPFRFLHSCTD